MCLTRRTQGTLAEAIKKKRFQGNQKWCERVALRALTRTATEVARGMAQLHDMGGWVRNGRWLVCLYLRAVQSVTER